MSLSAEGPANGLVVMIECHVLCLTAVIQNTCLRNQKHAMSDLAGKRYVKHRKDRHWDKTPSQ
jgi:hypothetical protein